MKVSLVYFETFEAIARSWLIVQYLPLPETDIVTNALNFDTIDSRVTGGCDVYTTKAAGSDKKLYKNIESSLESQYKSLLSFHAALPPSQHLQATDSWKLSRASPFGSLSQISSRRTFAYLIATLNASHSDYDFSHLLRPSDFRRESSSKKVMLTLNATLENLRPLHTPTLSFLNDSVSAAPSTPPGSRRWSSQMWDILDKQMGFSDCSVYSYAPEDDPFSDNGDEVALWSFYYFFFNKERKRVCYLYLRALSRLGSDTPGSKTPTSIVTVRSKRPASGTWSIGEENTGRKRAKFWLGDRAENAIVVADDDDDGEEVQIVAEKEKGDEHEHEHEHPFFERLSETASVSPSKGRSRERSVSVQRSKSRESGVGAANEKLGNE